MLDHVQRPEFHRTGLPALSSFTSASTMLSNTFLSDVKLICISYLSLSHLTVCSQHFKQ